MKTAFIWPGCDFHNLKWGGKRIDSFVVEVTPEEVDQHIFAYLTTQGRNDPGGPNGQNEYFLVSRDPTSVVSIAWYYPISHMWNGYSPFLHYKTRINSLADLLDLNLQHEFRRPDGALDIDENYKCIHCNLPWIGPPNDEKLAPCPDHLPKSDVEHEADAKAAYEATLKSIEELRKSGIKITFLKDEDNMKDSNEEGPNG